MSKSPARCRLVGREANLMDWFLAISSGKGGLDGWRMMATDDTLTAHAIKRSCYSNPSQSVAAEDIGLL